MKAMSKQDEHTLIYFQMLTNAFLDEENQRPPLKRIELVNEGDLNVEIVAMLQAMKILCEKLNPEIFADEDMIGFTHILNRLVIQNLFEHDNDNGNDSEGSGEEE